MPYASQNSQCPLPLIMKLEKKKITKKRTENNIISNTYQFYYTFNDWNKLPVVIDGVVRNEIWQQNQMGKGARAVDCSFWLCPKSFVYLNSQFIFDKSRNRVIEVYSARSLLLPLLRVHSPVVKLELESNGRYCTLAA